MPQILCILKAFWKHSLITFLVIVVAAALNIRSLPKEYVATASLLVNHVTKDPLVAQAAGVAADPAGMTFIPTQMELITGRGVLDPVISRLDLSHDKEFTVGSSGNPAALHEVVLTNLQKALTVAPGKGSDLLYISVSASDAQRAAQIANTVVDEYLKLDRSRAMGPAGERFAIYERDIKDLEKKVEEAQESVSAFRREHGMVDIEAENNNNDFDNQELQDLLQKQLNAQNTLRDLESRRAAGDSADAATADPNVANLRAKLITEQENLTQLSATLGPRHPNVMELQAQINATRHAIDLAVQAFSRSTSAEIQRARDLAGKYQAAVDVQKAKVGERRDLREQAQGLLLRLQSAQANYKAALDDGDRLRFDAASNTGNVTRVSSATPPPKADKPNKPKLFLLAFAAALGIGLGWPFAYELLLDRRLRCRDDLEKTFGIPVLAQLGPIGVRSA
jgi:uncharacterized protein involved in exopolysaccharide biosynthesis